ncbi:MAG: methionine synthase [Desulfatitalea sp.]|nr:cobalamin-dependent protein [Desulfatitalea sp.]NNK02733.1 methionine synthase [Desulfatitalea sp.]
MKELIDAVVDMMEDKAYELTRRYIDEGKAAEEIFSAYQAAMEQIGQRFEAGTYFVPELIMAGEMMKTGAEIIKPFLSQEDGRKETRKTGKFLLATVEGDIHDIGKDIVGMMMQVNGFEVMDLGVDVPAATIVAEARAFQPDIIGLSGLLTLAFDPMKKCVDHLTEAGLRADYKVIIGGAQMDRQVCGHIGADAFATDAMAGVNICKKWMGA